MTHTGISVATLRKGLPCVFRTIAIWMINSNIRGVCCAAKQPHHHQLSIRNGGWSFNKDIFCKFKRPAYIVGRTGGRIGIPFTGDYFEDLAVAAMYKFSTRYRAACTIPDKWLAICAVHIKQAGSRPCNEPRA